MSKKLIDAVINEKPLEFNQAFNDEMTTRLAQIVDNQKEHFAKTFLGAKAEDLPINSGETKE